MKARREAFSLVEVLVVVAILGILVGLLIPAIQSARESARRAECTNNQRQLALAVLQAEQAARRFPGYNNLQAIDAGGTRRPSSWVFAVLPFLEYQIVYDLHGKRGPDAFRGQAPNFAVAGLICPSDPWSIDKGLGSNWTALTYVANCGQVDVLTGPMLPPDWRANGVFMHLFPTDSAGNRVREQTTSLDYLQKGDGASRTLLLSENADAGFWTAAGEIDLGFVWEPTLIDGQPAPATIGRINENKGQRWFNRLASNQAVWQVAMAQGGLACGTCGGPLGPSLPPLPPPPDPPDPDDDDADPGDVEEILTNVPRTVSLARPSSFHTGGVVAVFADAHAVFLHEDVDYVTYCQMMSPDGAKATQSGTIDPVPAGYLRSVAD